MEVSYHMFPLYHLNEAVRALVAADQHTNWVDSAASFRRAVRIEAARQILEVDYSAFAEYRLGLFDVIVRLAPLVMGEDQEGVQQDEIGELVVLHICLVARISVYMVALVHSNSHFVVDCQQMSQACQVSAISCRKSRPSLLLLVAEGET